VKIRNREEPIKNELQMTSMIDVVFLLLIFFILTFKIVEMEGDFSIKMPLAGDSSAAADELDLPIKLRLTADPQGRLTAIQLNELALGTDFEALRGKVVELIGSGSGPGGNDEGPEVEIDTDYNLRYEYVIEAITHVSGYKQDGEVVKLIDKIKFAPPRR